MEAAEEHIAGHVVVSRFGVIQQPSACVPGLTHPTFESFQYSRSVIIGFCNVLHSLLFDFVWGGCYAP